MSDTLEIHQINLQRALGGGEVYTRFFTRALLALGCRVTLYVHAGAVAWRGLSHPQLSLEPVADEAQLLARLPRERVLVLTQGGLAPATREAIARRHFLCGFAHMPLAGGRAGESFRDYGLVVPVSAYVGETLRAAGCARIHEEPLYGVAEFERGDAAAEGPIFCASPYDWDRRKLRDRVLALLYPLARALRPRTRFERRSGLTLGIVSLLAPIKQYPLLLHLLAPILAQAKELSLEIFGHGGYASVRDLRRALAPLGARVRWWGFQPRVERIYPQLDYVLSGLPEKEALGLNLIEAQVCGTPVLAVRAPPFVETVADGESGFLYRDPREDGGSDFGRVFERIRCGPRPDPRQARDHLARFSFAQFLERTRRLLDALRAAAAGAR